MNEKQYFLTCLPPHPPKTIFVSTITPKAKHKTKDTFIKSEIYLWPVGSEPLP